MVLPNLIHPIPCSIEQIDRSTTIYDRDAREPRQTAKRKPPVVVLGQPRWFSSRELNAQPIGDSDASRGYVLFRFVDLNSASIVLDKDDRIVFAGNIVQPVYITRLEPQGHYQDQGGASLLKAWFTDRKPAKIN